MTSTAPRPTGTADAAAVLPAVLPALLRATAADLPIAVAQALADASPDLGAWVRPPVLVDGIPWASCAWGSETDPPIALVHGVGSNLDTFWRVAPAIAAAGRFVVAMDLPGHGRTGHWQGRRRFAQTAEDVAGFLRAAGLDRPDLAVLGHSWGGIITAALPGAGLRPERLILLDPPALPVAAMELMTLDPTERHFDDMAEAVSVIRSARPDWSDGDVYAKALGLTQLVPEAVLSVLLENGDWDGGLGALAHPAAQNIPVWLIRGEFRTEGLIPEEVVPLFAERIGADHVITIADAPHSPQRQYPEATVVAILRALGAVGT